MPAFHIFSKEVKSKCPTLNFLLFLQNLEFKENVKCYTKIVKFCSEIGNSQKHVAKIVLLMLLNRTT